jgi:hypothetical protein
MALQVALIAIVNVFQTDDALLLETPYLIISSVVLKILTDCYIYYLLTRGVKFLTKEYRTNL